MKKLYLLTSLVFLGFVNLGLAQPIVAVNSGNWSSPLTWAPNPPPSSVCNNCTIIINAGVTVTLDASVSFTGTTIMTIGSDATSPASLIITNSGAATFATGHNITLVNAGNSGAPPGIKLRNSNTTINASAAGQFDGIFTEFIITSALSIIQKQVGNSPGIFLSFGGVVTPLGGPPVHGPTFPGPATLSSSGAPLPIYLSAFDAVLDGKVVDLTWTSAIEVNSDHIDIERSADGANWNSLGTVQAKGNSSVAVNYSFTDVSPIHGTNYYRLKLVDIGGKYAYSQIRVVRTSLIQGLSVFPNPSHDYVNITLGTEYSGAITIRLVNQFGQVLQEKRLSNVAGTTVSFQVSTYSQGNYYLQVIQSDGTQQTGKVLISR